MNELLSACLITSIILKREHFVRRRKEEGRRGEVKTRKSTLKHSSAEQPAHSPGGLMDISGQHKLLDKQVHRHLNTHTYI